MVLFDLNLSGFKFSLSSFSSDFMESKVPLSNKKCLVFSTCCSLLGIIPHSTGSLIALILKKADHIHLPGLAESAACFTIEKIFLLVDYNLTSGFLVILLTKKLVTKNPVKNFYDQSGHQTGIDYLGHKFCDQLVMKQSIKKINLRGDLITVFYEKLGNMKYLKELIFTPRFKKNEKNISGFIFQKIYILLDCLFLISEISCNFSINVFTILFHPNMDLRL
ncbi:hypothetical protein BpHYR1_011857 [Brachionus plicatilis]|uniref:Uncharacterized protein n=1 Tax=Brachionus plicatilis TaxID=10195 RepID=A0A3M7RJL6_BRAPC|nr:hypothetical protein BpHYR1_011857 [Brachionus plicatilis]